MPCYTNKKCELLTPLLQFHKQPVPPLSVPSFVNKTAIWPHLIWASCVYPSKSVVNC